VSAGHLDALAMATKGLNEEQLEAFLEYEDQLLAAARTMSVDAFARSSPPAQREPATPTNSTGNGRCRR
jgi:hypothetical protein